MARMGPSQAWVKTALEQFFARRDLADRVQIFTADEWAATGKPRFEEEVGTIVLDESLYEWTQSGSEEAEAMNDHLWKVFRKLGVLPNSGHGNVWPLLAVRF